MYNKERIDEQIKALGLTNEVVSSNDNNGDSYDVVFNDLFDCYTCSKFIQLLKDNTVECICPDTAGLGRLLIRFV